MLEWDGDGSTTTTSGVVDGPPWVPPLGEGSLTADQSH